MSPLPFGRPLPLLGDWLLVEGCVDFRLQGVDILWYFPKKSLDNQDI